MKKLGLFGNYLYNRVMGTKSGHLTNQIKNWMIHVVYIIKITYTIYWMNIKCQFYFIIVTRGCTEIKSFSVSV